MSATPEAARTLVEPCASEDHADAEHGRAHRAVTLVPPAVVVRLHPSASVQGTFWWQNTSLAPRRSGFDSRRLHFRRSGKCPRRRKAVRTTPPLSLRRKRRLRSVNGSTRPLYGRSAGSTPAGGSLASLSGGGSRPPLAPLSALLPTGCATRHCPACIQALSDASGNRELDARSSAESTALVLVRLQPGV
jgi:hypothetical protein